MSIEKEKKAYMLQFFDGTMALGNAAYPAYFNAIRKVNSPWNWTVPFLFRKTHVKHEIGLDVVKLVSDLQTKAIDVDLTPEVTHEYKIEILRKSIEMANAFGKFGDDVIHPFIQFIKNDNKWLEQNGINSRQNEFAAIYPKFLKD